MKSWKTWGAMLTLLAASVLACFGGSAAPNVAETVIETHNLRDDPTDGKPFDGEDCAGPTPGEPFCVRDGDFSILVCEGTDATPTATECETTEEGRRQLCWGDRDTIPATCIDEGAFNTGGVAGGRMEPGSDQWLQLYEQYADEIERIENQEKPSGSPGSSCCKVCTSSKACGDSCISKSKTCNVGRGCACNG